MWIAIVVIVALIGWYISAGLNTNEAAVEQETSGEVQGEEDSVYDGTTGKDASVDVELDPGAE